VQVVENGGHFAHQYTSLLFVIVPATRKTMDEKSFVVLVVGASC